MSDDEAKVTGVCVDIPTIIADAKYEKHILSQLELLISQQKTEQDNAGTEAIRS